MCGLIDRNLMSHSCKGQMSTTSGSAGLLAVREGSVPGHSSWLTDGCLLHMSLLYFFPQHTSAFKLPFLIITLD